MAARQVGLRPFVLVLALTVLALGLLSAVRPAAADPPAPAAPVRATPTTAPAPAVAPDQGDTPGSPLSSSPAPENPAVAVSQIGTAAAAEPAAGRAAPRTGPAPNSWTQQLPTNAPQPRFDQSLALDSGHSQDVLFGGCTGAGACLNDTWLWTGSTSSWGQAVAGAASCTNACPNSPSARGLGAMAYDGTHVMLFGGLTAGGSELSDTWTWDGNAWTQQSPAQHPQSRDSAAVAFDITHNKIVLFGGCAGYANGKCSAFLQDTWVWDGTALTWTSICGVGQEAACGPSFRIGAGMAWDGAETVLVGGFGSSNAFLLDTWTWSGSTWTAVCGVSGKPGCLGASGRDNMGMAFDPTSHSAVLYGGFAGLNFINQPILLADTWSFSGGAWTQLCGQNNTPCPSGKRTQFGMAWDGTRAIAVGGESIPAAANNAQGPITTDDTWGWDGTTWTLRQAGEPTARDSYATAYDATHQQVVLFGGTNQTLEVSFGDTWTWDGTNWTLHQPATSPPARDFAAMAWDGAKLVLFGGDFSNSQQADTWTWDGSAWTAICGTSVSGATGACGPSKRERPASAQASGGAILFGGDACTSTCTTLNDTWLWNGSAWSATSPTTSPSIRTGASLAYNSDTHANLLFGGTVINANPYVDLADAWNWNGTTWSAVCGTTSPSTAVCGPEGRESAGLAYDAAHQKMTLFGGRNATTFTSSNTNAGALDDTWIFDGAAWFNVSPATTNPPPREYIALAFDAQAANTVLFGGFGCSGQFCGGTDASDTWTWLGDSASPPTVAQISISSGPGNGGTPITITGTGFDTSGGTTVSFGFGNHATGVSCSSSMSCTATSPAGAGIVDVIATTAAGSSPLVAADKFSYVPVVGGVNPPSGTTAGGTATTISGFGFLPDQNFKPVTTFSFGANAAPGVSCASQTTCTALSPAGSGTVDVTATTAGTSLVNAPADHFSYIAPPVVTSSSPSSGPAAGGTQVTINGSGLSVSGFTTQVLFGTFAGTSVDCPTSSSCTATSPAGDGIVPVTVSVGGSQSAVTSAAQFTYTGATADTWLQQTPPQSPPYEDSGGLLAYDPTHKQMVLFGLSSFQGGCGGTGNRCPGTWLWDGSTWRPSCGTAITPACPQGHFAFPQAMAWDGTQIVLFMDDTSCGSSQCAETWTWNGSVWSEACGQSPACGPARRQKPALTYSPPTGGIVLFGGESPTGFELDDTWLWNGSGWTQQFPATSPAARAVPSASGDLARNQVVLFGGANGSGVAYDDTWTWDGTNWTQQLSPGCTASCPNSPPPVTQGTTSPISPFSYDAATGVAFLYAPDGTPWTWNGSAWTHQQPVASPPNHSGTSVAYDAAENLMVLFGGTVGTCFSNNTCPNDAWTWFGGAEETTPPTVTGVNPAAGPPAGGTRVTVTGAGFMNFPTSVNFGANAGTAIDIQSDTQLLVTSPAGTGTVDVRVTGANGTSLITLADQFSYVPTPSVTSIDVTSGPAAGGTVVHVGGTGLSEPNVTSQVFFGTFAATGVSCTATSCTATSPAGDGTMPVTVAVGASRSPVNLSVQFSYTGAATDTWLQQTPPQSPPAESAAAMAYDATNHVTVLFAADGTTWTYDGATWTEALTNQSGNGKSPGARQFANMAFDGTRVVLFGGTAGAACCNTSDFGDTWTWNGSAWTVICSAPNCGPQAREQATLADDSAHNQLVLFGGCQINGSFCSRLNDTWTWSPSTEKWTQQVSAGCTSACPNSPPLRQGANMVFDAGHGYTLLFGGLGCSPNTLQCTDTWTFSGGTNTWANVTPPAAGANPPTRFYFVMAYDAAHSVPMLFGGDGANGAISDTWTWDGSAWFQQQPSASPPARDNAAAVYDGQLGLVLLFGGQDPNGGPLGDTWTWFGLTPASRTPTVTAVNPGAGPVAGGTTVTVTGSGFFEFPVSVKFGTNPGTNVTVQSDTQLTVTSPASSTGTVDVTVTTADGTSATSNADQYIYAPPPSVTGINPATGPAAGGTSVTVSGSGFTASGVTTSVFFGTVAATSVNCSSSMSCTATSPAGDGIAPVTVALGASLSPAVAAAQFTYTGAASDTWTQEQTSIMPPKRSDAMAAFDSLHGQTVLFGGAMNNSGGVLNDTWVWDGSTVWTQVADTGAAGCTNACPSSPPARTDGTMAYDAKNNITMLFGGSAFTPCPFLFGCNDTWTWNGAAWTQVADVGSPGCASACPNSPPGRENASMAFDAKNNVIVLFGGTSDGCPSPFRCNDTWTFDGSTNTWTQLCTASPCKDTLPTPRESGMMAFDGQHIILYGGFGGANPVTLGDMWSWDGTNWTAICGSGALPACAPGSRSGGLMAYDSTAKRVVLFGGGSTNDTWTWDGSTWTKQTPSTSPSKRFNATFVYDSAHQESVLFGGLDGTTFKLLGDTWTWFENSGPACKTGDVNCNGVVDATDALCVLRLVAQLGTTLACPVPEPNPAKIATDGSQNLDATDALCILRAVAKLAATQACPSFPAPIANRTEGTGDRGQGTETEASASGERTSPPSFPGKGAGGLGDVTLTLQPAEVSAQVGRQTPVTLALDASRPLGAWTIDIAFDPTQVKVVDCQAANGGICNADYAAGGVRVVGASASGLSGQQTLETLTFEGLGHTKTSSLALTATLADANGEPLAAVQTAPPTETPTPPPTSSPTPAPPSTPTATPRPRPTPSASAAPTSSPTATPKRRP